MHTIIRSIPIRFTLLWCPMHWLKTCLICLGRWQGARWSQRGLCGDAQQRGQRADRRGGHSRYSWNTAPGSPLSRVAVVLALVISHSAWAQFWQDLGPGPSYEGQVEGIVNKEVVGAVNTLAAHPTNPDILYIGAVNGGIWRTQNANDAAPNWVRLTDSLGSLSIGSIRFDPTDTNAQTLVAGIANTSSLSSIGGQRIGILRSTNGGNSWNGLGGSTLLNRNIIGVAARGAVLIALADNGLFRSSNTGSTFSEISLDDGSSTGLPAGSFTDLASDRVEATRFFVALTSATAGGSVGIYRSINTGANWARVSSPALEAAMDGTQRVEIATGTGNSVFVAVVDGNGKLSHVFRSGDGGTTWSDMGVPVTTEGTAIQGIHPGSQGGIHLSLVADPNNTNVVYIGGDRQPRLNEGGTGDQTFPNSLGAEDFSGRLFRGDASQSAATRWQSITHSGAANNSSPHADSRDMTFNAAGVLLQADDGGVYRRTQPQSNNGQWFSINGNLQSTEYHGIAYDRVSKRVIGGAQDTGTTEQTSGTTRIFTSVSTGDGGDPSVEIISPNQSVRYSSFQRLAAFRRRTCDNSGSCTNVEFPALTPTGGAPAITPQFYTPLLANRHAQARILIGASNGLYESVDRGDTVARISTAVRVSADGGTPMIYGLPGNPDFVLVAGTRITTNTRGDLYRRSDPPPAPLSLINSLGVTINDLAIDPGNANQIFLVTASTVRRSTDAGSSFNDITGNLLALTSGPIRSAVFIPNANPGLVVGATTGVFVARADSNYSQWSRLANGLPNAIAWELDHDAADDALIVGTLGRGAWKLSPALPVIVSENIFRNGFEAVP